MLRIVIVVTLAALATAPRNAAAQELGTPDGGPAADSLAPVALYQPAVQVPDSVRRKVGYQHWKGGAIGAGAGAIAGLLLGLAARQSCSHCDPNLAATSLSVAGFGGGLGFLVGLASPKYRSLPDTGLQNVPRLPADAAR